MKKILVLGNTGLNDTNNSTNNRMIKIFETMNQEYSFFFDYYKLRDATLNVKYIHYLNDDANSSIYIAIKTILKQNIKYDIVIAETFNASIIAYILYKVKKIPFIWRQFGTTFNDELDSKFYLKPKILLKFILHKFISNSKGCKAVVVTEDGCANRTLYLNKLKMEHSKLFMVKNQRTIDFKNVRENKQKSFHIVQIGRITAWKKIHILLEAIVNIKKTNSKIIKELTLDIIGQSQDIEYEERLREIIQTNGLEKQISFKKDLEYHQIEEILNNTTLSISLTAYNPIIESLQNSVPVITYEYGEIGKVFEKCKAVFILAKDIKKSSFLSKEEELIIQKELEKKIIYLFSNKEKLHELGEDGKKFVEDNFPLLDEHVSEITDIYMKVINAL